MLEQVIEMRKQSISSRVLIERLLGATEVHKCILGAEEGYLLPLEGLVITMREGVWGVPVSFNGINWVSQQGEKVCAVS